MKGGIYLKIEKIAEDQIKITITIDDLEARNIDLYSFMYNSPESQDLFWDVMNEAERELDFNVDDSMIYVEASTSGGGNFTLIVTRTNEKPVIKFNAKKHAKKENIKLKRKKMPLVMTNTIFCFNSFDDICNFCKTVDVSKLGDNTLYSANDIYYLKANEMPYTNILEYASIARFSSMFEAKMSEYGKTVIDSNALQTISKYFNKKKRTFKKPKSI